jgi:hypothetical protein
MHNLLGSRNRLLSVLAYAAGIIIRGKSSILVCTFVLYIISLIRLHKIEIWWGPRAWASMINPPIHANHDWTKMWWPTMPKGYAEACHQRKVARYGCHLLTLVPRSRIFLHWRWRWHVAPKSRFNSQDVHGATSQKTAFFIVTAVKTSNPTKLV